MPFPECPYLSPSLSPRSIAVGLLWVLWACNTVLQQAIGRATQHQYLDRSVAHVLRIGIE